MSKDEKLIIENKSDLPMDKVLELVKEVVSEGKISNEGKQYCYISVAKIKNKEYSISCTENKNSYKFLVL